MLALAHAGQYPFGMFAQQGPKMTMEQRKQKIEAQTAAFRANVPNDCFVGAPRATFGGLVTHQGARQYQEDRGIFNETFQTKDGKTYKVYGVFDGHGGFATSTYCQKQFTAMLKDVANDRLGKDSFSNILYDTVLKIDLTWNAYIAQVNKFKEHGTTLNVLVIEEATGRSWVANTADSRCFMLTKDPKTKATGFFATTDHNVASNASEKKRILDCGGKIDQGYCMWDTNPLGGWAIARHIGSRDLCVATIPHSDIYVKPLENIELFVIASDGFWDVIQNQEAEKICRALLKDGFSEQEMAEKLLEFCLARTRYHFQGKLWDNVTIVVVSNKPKVKDVEPCLSPLARILKNIEMMNENPKLARLPSGPGPRPVSYEQINQPKAAKAA